GTQQMAVAPEHLLADRDHLPRRHTQIDIEVSQRAVEPGDVFLDAEGLAVEASRHVEDRIAAQKSLVPERNDDLALADDLAVEPGYALVAERHRSPFPIWRLARLAPPENSSATRLWRRRRTARCLATNCGRIHAP